LSPLARFPLIGVLCSEPQLRLWVRYLPHVRCRRSPSPSDLAVRAPALASCVTSRRPSERPRDALAGGRLQSLEPLPAAVPTRGFVRVVGSALQGPLDPDTRSESFAGSIPAASISSRRGEKSKNVTLARVLNAWPLPRDHSLDERPRHRQKKGTAGGRWEVDGHERGRKPKRAHDLCRLSCGYPAVISSNPPSQGRGGDLRVIGPAVLSR
jgi:hypothetical protein